MDIVALFCDLDDFYQAFAPAWQKQLLPTPGPHRRRVCRLSASEMMTLLVAFHHSDYRTFKHFYRKEVCCHRRAEFPNLVSYQRLIERLPSVLVPLAAYLRTRLERTRGIAFIDSLPLPVCHNRRIYCHQVFAGSAQRGKSSRGWFYGCKLPLLINDEGALWAARALALGQAAVTQTGAVIRSVGEQLKPVCRIAPTRHRRVYHAFVHASAALAAYTWQEHKPSRPLTPEEQILLAEAF